ncbi:hypothetical protein CFAEC_06865 [Corynebacterium faecale]|nr:hypothetical protein CFAEC_06865 [Corynebacterium faecale]
MSGVIRVMPVKRTYGNRIPPVYRWAVSALVAISLMFVVIAAATGALDLVRATVFTAIGLMFLVLYHVAGTLVTADAEAVRIWLFPLWRKRVPADQIASIHVETITPIDREWGNRGSLRKDGELFLDAGQSRRCLAFYLVDGTVIRLGVCTPEHGDSMALSLHQLLGVSTRPPQGE